MADSNSPLAISGGGGVGLDKHPIHPVSKGAVLYWPMGARMTLKASDREVDRYLIFACLSPLSPDMPMLR